MRARRVSTSGGKSFPTSRLPTPAASRAHYRIARQATFEMYAAPLRSWIEGPEDALEEAGFRVDGRALLDYLPAPVVFVAAALSLSCFVRVSSC